jgi:formate dehydrogenase major subunit
VNTGDLSGEALSRAPDLMLSLGADYRATFLALGAQGELPLKVVGAELTGIGTALEFLKRPELQGAAKGARVVVIGGGNTAMDAARVALRRGAREALVLYRRGAELLPAFADEVEEAREEGVAFRFLAGPVAFLGADGRVSAIRCLEMGRAADRSEAPAPVAGSAFEIPCELVLSATGQVPLLTEAVGSLRQDSGRLWIDGRGRTSRRDFFAGGDLVQSKGSVVDAMASGKRAALAIHLSLTRDADAAAWVGAELGDGSTLSLQAFFRPPAHWEPAAVVRLDELDYLGCELKFPAPDRKRAPEKRLAGFEEVSLPASREEAVEEANRCFFCGTCAGCEKCRLYCPDSSMVRHEEAAPVRAAYLPDDAYCKGCGTCAEACPRGVLDMREGGEIP